MAGGKTFSRPARCGRATHLAGLQDVEIGRGHCICSGRGATHLAGLQGVGIKGIRHCIYSCRGQHICCGTTHITAGSTQGDGNIARRGNMHPCHPPVELTCDCLVFEPQKLLQNSQCD
eukprot:scaffold215036_cov24-Tisochrysis_lutea.AAC.1